MKSQTWITEHDLSITFDHTGRMWKFRPTKAVHGRQPVDATLAGNAIVVTVTVPGLECGDVDLSATGDVLHIRGRADRTIDLACDVGLPRRVDLDVLETAYAGEILEVRVPLIPARAETDTALESIPVAV